MKSAKIGTIQVYKERKSEVSLILNTVYEFENNKYSITDTSNIESKSRTWFWNNNANKSDPNIEEDRFNNNSDKNKKKRKKIRKKKEFKIQKTVCLDV